MKDSAERRTIHQENIVVCVGGFVLRKREWSDRGQECLEGECPHPITCTTRHRDLLSKKEN